MIPAFTPAPPYVVPTTMVDVIRHLGLQASLEYVLDASDKNSWPGSGQYFLDVSGNNRHFTLGDNASDSTADPTFAGIVGRQSSAEYATFPVDPSGPWIWTDASSGPGNMLHKDGAIFTWAGYRRATRNVVNGQLLVINLTAASNCGVIIGIASNSVPGNESKLNMELWRNFSTVDFQSIALGPVVGDNVLTFLAVSYNETTGDYILQVNGTQVTGTQAYVSPPTTNATKLYMTNNGTEMNLYADALWSRALSASELNLLYNATRAKYGL